MEQSWDLSAAAFIFSLYVVGGIIGNVIGYFIIGAITNWSGKRNLK